MFPTDSGSFFFPQVVTCVKNILHPLGEIANPILGDTRRHEESPLFIKNLPGCHNLHNEVVKGADLDTSNCMALLGGGSPAAWILSISQRFVVGFFVVGGAYFA